jgi:AcrR family transcriptional regulator
MTSAAPDPGVLSRRRVILTAAAEAFHEKGFHGVGVDAIGRRAGLSGPALYRHFSGKDHILATLLDEAMDELAGALVPVLPDPEADLERALRHHVDFAIRERHLVGLYQRDSRNLAEPWQSAFATRTRAYTKAWEELVAAAHPGAAPSQVPAATQAALGMLFSVWSWPDRIVTTSKDLSGQLLSMLKAALHASPPPRRSCT